MRRTELLSAGGYTREDRHTQGRGRERQGVRAHQSRCEGAEQWAQESRKIEDQRKVTRSAIECGSGAAETLLGFSLPLELPGTAISSTGGE